MRTLKTISFSPTVSRPAARISPVKVVALSNLAAYKPARKPIDIYGGQPNSWLSLADASLLLKKQIGLAARQKEYARAVALLDRLITYEPHSAEHYANRGLMHYFLQATEKALADYNRALVIDPALDKAYSNRANLYAAQQNWAAAIADYDRAIDLNPLNARARLNQAITFREMGEYEEALICLDIAMFFEPTSAFLRAERGRIYHLQGDWNGAIADYKKALLLIEPAHSHDALTRQILRWMSNFE
ncbi:MAG: tetratricopeptide repeat protein [Phormidesmis sp.]